MLGVRESGRSYIYGQQILSRKVAIAQLGERQTEVHFGCLSGGHVFNPHLAQNVSPVNGEEFLFASVRIFCLMI